MQLIKTVVYVTEAMKNERRRGKKKTTQTSIYEAPILSMIQAFFHSSLRLSQRITVASVPSRFLKLWNLSLKEASESVVYVMSH